MYVYIYICTPVHDILIWASNEFDVQTMENMVWNGLNRLLEKLRNLRVVHQRKGQDLTSGSTNPYHLVGGVNLSEQVSSHEESSSN